MYDLNEDTITDAVLARFAETPDGRLKLLVQALVRHLHGFVREPSRPSRSGASPSSF
jgi:hydroxyquinol 1,2-dioxygenase